MSDPVKDIGSLAGVAGKTLQGQINNFAGRIAMFAIEQDELLIGGIGERLKTILASRGGS
jgi:hypothetical protein